MSLFRLLEAQCLSSHELAYSIDSSFRNPNIDFDGGFWHSIIDFNSSLTIQTVVLAILDSTFCLPCFLLLFLRDFVRGGGGLPVAHRRRTPCGTRCGSASGSCEKRRVLRDSVPGSGSGSGARSVRTKRLARRHPVVGCLVGWLVACLVI